MNVFRLCSTNLLKLNKINVRKGLEICKTHELFRTQIATIIGVERKDPEIDANKPKPWPYLTKRYWYHHFWFGLDCSTPDRIDCNSKIIVLEGNKGSAKEEVAKALSKEFGMKYFPESNLDQLYLNHKGFDYRSLNKYLAPKIWAFDEKMFYENPSHEGCLWMPMDLYVERFKQYIDALTHLFNTGEGVILERSPYSDFVFIEAMYKSGYFPSEARDYYYRIRHSSIYSLMRPHLVIYLDVSVDECLKRIKKRNIPHEVNSKVLNKQYLQEIEDQYKNRYLPEAGKSSEVLIYDWNNYGDLEDVIEDIEKLNMDEWDPHLEKFEDWNLWGEDLWTIRRVHYTNKKQDLVHLASTNVPHYDVDCLVIDHDDVSHRDKVYANMVPNYGILPSFDPDLVPVWKLMLKIRTKTYREVNDFALRNPYL